MKLAQVSEDLPLFGLSAAELPADVLEGLQQLGRGPSVWPIDQAGRWVADVARVTAFAAHWDARARAAGWSDLQLYGLHRYAPYANLAGMGVAFVVALGRSTVLDVQAEAINIATPTGSRLQFVRRPPDPAAVLAWSLGSR
ncbi:MAG: hypothetical protein K2X57_21890 [Xanthobacteraceae bacterium]|nr:hypothetical protein [Xanthobacteraceae bacterium]